MMLESALMSGVMPRFTEEYIKIGNVVDPGPAVKKLTTKSSKLIVKAKRAPDAIPGRMRGKVT